jgi:L-ascorbate metabolism protein UlaG (beta-lactamase superfamily)
MRATNWGACLAVLGTLAAPATAQSVNELLNADMARGAATLWYLGHAGWAVKTRDHLLIFDYWESHEPPRDGTLANGFIDAAEIAGQRTIVFVTHQHGDHYDPKIFQWADTVRNITYVFGWNVTTDQQAVRMLGPRETRQIDGVMVATINHEFDNVPEVAFLVEVDGLVIYHSGDHGTVTEDPNPVFVDNIDYLSSLGRQIDIAFVSTFGRIGGGMVNNGDRYTIGKLKPRALFPMHHGGNEDLYEKFAREMKNEDAATAVHYADRRGECFTYAAGRVRKN